MAKYFFKWITPDPFSPNSLVYRRKFNISHLTTLLIIVVLVFHNFDVGNLVSKSLRESLENSLFFCLLPIIIVIIQFQVQSISTYPHALFVPFINWMPLIAMMSIRTDMRSPDATFNFSRPFYTFQKTQLSRISK